MARAVAAEPASLAEKAYFAIRELIVSLELRPGAVVDERELMERFGIGSRRRGSSRSFRAAAYS